MTTWASGGRRRMGGSGSSSMWDHTAFDLGASLLRACAIVSRISEPNCASCACAKSLCAHHCPLFKERERERTKRMSRGQVDRGW